MNEIIYPPCKKCGSSHGMGIEERDTGVITPIDLCYECLFENLMWKPIDTQIELFDLDGLKERLKKMENNLCGKNSQIGP